jgi:hypothetical protein
MPFGKYRGYELWEIPRGYLEWLLDNCDLHSGLANAVEEQLYGYRGSRDRYSPPPPPPSAPGICVPPNQVPMTLEIVNSGYRALALKLHPDHGGDAETMRQLNALAESLRTQLQRMR